MPIPPKKVQDNAKEGLELRRQWGRGGTAVGVARARDLSNGADLSIETIKRMAQFNRHRQNYKPNKKESDGGPTAGTIAWLLWGGTEGVDWAIRISKQDQNKSINKSMQFSKSYKFEVKSLEELDNVFTLSGYASIFAEKDMVNDVIEKGAFVDSLKIRMPKFLWGHDMKQPTLGVFTKLMEDDYGLYFEANMPKDDSYIRDRIIPQIKIGALDSFSIGFNILDHIMEKGLKIIKKALLFEISLVTIPMHPKALVTGYKSFSADLDLPFADRETEWNGDEAIKRIREYTNSDDMPSEDYEKYFMYYDEENKDNFTAYKLPFADIIEGEPHIIPRAIFAIAGALQGARGGLDVPDNDRATIIANINKIYQQMAEEFNDDSLVSPLLKNVSEAKTIKDIEAVLKSRGFSNRESKTFISAVKDIISQRDVESDGTRDVSLNNGEEVISSPQEQKECDALQENSDVDNDLSNVLDTLKDFNMFLQISNINNNKK